MEARFRMRNGEFEIELEGERSFVEAQLAQHLDRWHALANGIASEVGTPAVIRVATTPAEPGKAGATSLRASTSIEDFPRVSPDFRPKVNVTIADFVRMKQATTAADVFVVGVYYLEKYRQMETFAVDELQTLLEDVPAWECHRAEDVLEEVVVRGHVEALRDGRYSITYKGQNYVRDGLT